MSNAKITLARLASLLAQLQGVDISVFARAANFPLENVRSWLEGNVANLKVQSVVNLMGMLGLKLAGGQWKVDPERVHFWELTVPATGNVDVALAPLTALSKMLAGGAITQILPPKKARGGMSRTDYYMIGSNDLRVVVVLRRPAFRKARITPEVIKGACWRDDNRHHTMLIPATHWGHVVSRDMTPKEFDQAFNESMGAMSWDDLSMAARQYNLSPEDMMGWIRQRYETDGMARAASEAGADVEVPAGLARVIHLGHTSAAPRRTGTGG